MKIKLYILSFLLMIPFISNSQDFRIIKGVVKSAGDNLPVIGASIRATLDYTTSNSSGSFFLKVLSEIDTIEVSSVGYHSFSIIIEKGKNNLEIQLESQSEQLEDVIVSTGYYQLPRERSTGLFSYIDNEQINKSASPDIISRLEGVMSGLVFDRRSYGTDKPEQQSLRVRGIATLHSESSPLIVVDNFPYEDDVNNINPNDVESITVLKDAAATSIWGARAGNGVIVITTKSGHFEQPLQISFNSNVTLGKRPDLYYNPLFLSSPEFIEVEKELFRRNYYLENNWTPLSPAIEAMIMNREQKISDEELSQILLNYSKKDVRKQISSLIYQPLMDQQYSVNLRGGSESYNYYLSTGIDHALHNLIGNKNKRISLATKHSIKIKEKLNINLGTDLVFSDAYSNGIHPTHLVPLGKSSIYPYAQLKDDQNNSLPIIRNLRMPYVENPGDYGFMDWLYRPMDEINQRDNYKNVTENRSNIGINYPLFRHFNLDFKYQYQQSKEKMVYHNFGESYKARDSYNQFLQLDGSNPYPKDGNMLTNLNKRLAHSSRIQLNYHKKWSGKYEFNGLAGAEVRQEMVQGSKFELYGFDKEVFTNVSAIDYITRFRTNPRGNTMIISPPTSGLTSFTDRYISYFGNASYFFKDRYIFSASLRWDASNLFGVKTNQKGVPLWSSGFSWIISNEAFYNLKGIPYLKLRTTYGQNGNVNKRSTAFVTASYGIDPLSNLQNATIRNPGNPQLRWEKIKLLSLGLDFKLLNNRIWGNIDWYSKDGVDLIGNTITDPTSGWDSRDLSMTYTTNYANIKSQGVDLEVGTGFSFFNAFKMSNSFLLSYSKNRVTKYNANKSPTLQYTSASIPVEGYSIDEVYALPWYGLDPENGNPLVMVDGRLISGTEAYTKYNSILEFSQLLSKGVSMPLFDMVIRNEVTWRNMTLGANLTLKTGFYFKRSSIDYSRLFNSWEGHEDFKNRWRSPGDEEKTKIPSMPETTNSLRESFYKSTEALIENGDHLRLQDVTFSYDLQPNRIGIKSIRLYAYARNLGIIWKASNTTIDPDYPNANLLPPSTFALGIRANF